MEKKKIKVHLQYPWKFPDSPYYKYLIDNPPKGIEYLNAEKQKGVITNKSKFLFSNRLKKIIRGTLNKLSLSIPNAHKSPKGDYDLIHCAHCLSKNQDKPWVADIEMLGSLAIPFSKNKDTLRKVKKYLSSNNCKKILPWTEHTKNQILEEFPEIKNKIEVVYPAVPLNVKEKNKKEVGKITILYATRYFWLKGGIISLEVYKKLKEKYGGKVELIFISDVPEEIKKRYPELKIKDLVPQEELYEHYKNADIFFYPSFMDTFGLGQLEAMSFGLPIVTVNTKYTKSRKEIIEERKHGFIFDVPDISTDKLINTKEDLIISSEEKEIINKLFENCSELIGNKKLREKMSKNCIKEIKDGKFSIKDRNKKLKRIYGEALK